MTQRMTQPTNEKRFPRRAVRRVASSFQAVLLATVLMIGGTLVALPDTAEARDEPRTVRNKPARTATPPARTSTPPARSSTPRAKPSTPPARTSTPQAKPKPKPSPRTSSPPQRGSDHRAGGSDGRSDRGHVRRGTPAPRTGGGDTIFHRRSYGDRDRERSGDYRGRTENHRYRDRDRYDHHRDYDHRDYGHRDYDHRRHDHRRGHVHTAYCGHGYYGSYGWGYGWGGYYGYAQYRHYRYPWFWNWWPTIYVAGETHRDYDSGAMDLDVRPEEAQIFLDGQYVGKADDYDGFPTYLWLPEGTYDVAFFHPGYETIFRQVSIYPGVVIDFEDRMRPGEAVHPDEYGPSSTVRRDARIQRNREKEAAARRTETRRDDEWSDVTYGSPSRSKSADRPAATTPPAGDKIGRLYVAVLPPDAAVYLDGHFLGTAGELGQLSAGLVVEPGEHVVELVRPGYATARETVIVPPGEKIAVERELLEEE